MRETGFLDYAPGVEWRTLFAYERALRCFLRAHPAHLPASTFDRLFAAPAPDLPESRFLDLGDFQMGFRRYEAAADVHLVLVHGAGCYGDQLHPLASVVARAGKAQAYTLDMRGHGQSSGEPGHAVAYPGQIVQDVARFVARLKSERPQDRVVLGGHSAGGGVVLGVSRSEAKHLVDGYLFLAPYLGLGSPTVRPLFGGWTTLRSIRLRALVAANLIGVGRFNGATVVDFDDHACRHDPRLTKSWSFNTMLAFGAGRWLSEGPAIPANKPVLLVAGTQDECFFQPLYADALQVVAPHADMAVIEGCGHFDLLVDETAAGAVADWLDRQIPARKTAHRVTEKNNAVAA